MIEIGFRTSKSLLLIILLVLVLSLIGHYVAEAAGATPQIGLPNSGDKATAVRSTDTAPSSTSLLHVGLIIGDPAPIEALLGLTLALYVSSNFRLFPPFPPFLRPPIPPLTTLPANL